MTTNASTNPCRYGYLYGLQPAGVTTIAFADVRKHKPRSLTAPSMLSMADYYLYTVPRVTLERYLLGKNVNVPLTPTTYAAALSSDLVTLVSPLPLSTATSILNPTHLDDYLAHLYACDPAAGIQQFLVRNSNPAQVDFLRDYLADAVDSSPELSLHDQLVIAARNAVDLIDPHPNTRDFVNKFIFPTLANSWSLDAIAANGGTLDLTWDSDDIALGAETGVVSLDVTPHGTREHSRKYLFSATMRPDAADYPCVVVHHSRGILHVAPLLDPPSHDITSREVLQDWAEAIPVVGQVAKAAVTSAYHFKRTSSPMPTTLVAAVAATSAVSISLESPAWADFPSALTNADMMAIDAGLTAANRKILNRQMLEDAATGLPVWRYRAYVNSCIHELIQQQEMGHLEPVPAVAARGASHTHIPVEPPTPPQLPDVELLDPPMPVVSLGVDELTSVTLSDPLDFLSRYATAIHSSPQRAAIIEDVLTQALANGSITPETAAEFRSRTTHTASRTTLGDNPPTEGPSHNINRSSEHTTELSSHDATR